MKLNKMLILGALTLVPILSVACNNTQNGNSGGSSNGDGNNEMTSGNTAGIKDISENNTFKKIFRGESNTLLSVNQNNELLRYKDNAWTKIASNINQNGTILESRGRISAIDKDGNYVVVQNNRETKTNLKISLRAGFVHLGAANIIVVNRDGKYFLARVESSSPGSISSINTNMELLADSQPVQIGIGSSNNSDGPDIAVLAKPSSQSDYTHGVLGDKIEAKSIFVVERHNMNDVRAQINLTDTSVFEESRLIPIKINGKFYLVTVLSGENNKGARIAIISQKGSNLQIAAKGEQLPLNSWLGFQVVNQTDLYVNQTPHVGGSLFKYNLNDLNNIKTEELAKGISTHIINTDVEVLFSGSSKNIFVPSTSLKELNAINLENKAIEKVTFNSEIISLKSEGSNSVYVLLKSGKVMVYTV